MRTLVYFFFFVSMTALSQNFKTLTDYDGYVPESVKNSMAQPPFHDFKGDVVDINNLNVTDFNYLKTSIVLLDDTGKIAGYGLTAEKDTYKLLYLYENYVEVYDSTGKYFRLGAAIEIKVDLQTKKAGLNLTDLVGIAILAEKKKIQGSLSVSAKGFSSDNIFGLFNINSSIDRASVQQILKSTGIMISKFSEDAVNLTPVILGYQSKKGEE